VHWGTNEVRVFYVEPWHPEVELWSGDGLSEPEPDVQLQVETMLNTVRNKWLSRVSSAYSQ